MGLWFRLARLGCRGFGYNLINLSLSKITVYSPRAPKTNMMQAMTHASIAEIEDEDYFR